MTYGCQMNVHESEKLAGALKRLGYENECTDFNDADIIVFNTCCIRENAEDHAYGNIGMLKNLKKQKKDLIIAVGGCMTQQKEAAEKLHKTFPFVDIIFGSLNLDEFEQLVKEKLNQKKSVIKIIDENYGIVEGNEPYRTSYPNAWVNIAYGCNNFCTYCIVPYVRGRERSRLPENVVDEVKNLVNEGYKEITLLGQNVNSYGHDLKNDVGFASLLDEIGKIEGKFRLRFMSNHPKDLTEDVIEAIKRNPHACHAIHLPVQSGSNRILSLMSRRYSVEKYLSQIESIRKIIPDCAITTDIIVGFPTETEEDFAESMRFAEKIGFAKIHVFQYSPRTGTPAAKMPQIAASVKAERADRMKTLADRLHSAHLQSLVGKTVAVLFERENSTDFHRGYAPDYTLIKISRKNPQKSLRNQIIRVIIEENRSDYCFGRLESEAAQQE